MTALYIGPVLKALGKGEEPSKSELCAAFNEIIESKATEAQAGAFLALVNPQRCDGDTIAAFAKVILKHASAMGTCSQYSSRFDVVGTGGDGKDTFNVSTSVGFIVQAVAQKHDSIAIVKHGNRSASSKCGSADFIEQFVGNLDLDSSSADMVLSRSRHVFLFARNFHPALKAVGPIRQQLGFRTVFNILGPLVNPARPTHMLAGVFSADLGRVYAEALRAAGVDSAWVVCGKEGLDELSIAGPSNVWRLVGSEIYEFVVSPADFGLPCHPLEECCSGTAAENSAVFRELVTPQAEVATTVRCQ